MLTELQFKLKKGGVCVGYERHNLTAHGAMMLQQRNLDGEWKVLLCGQNSYTGWINHDEKCQFVCIDRAGQDVYAGDMVREDGRYWHVRWDESDLGWCLRDLRGERPPQIPDPRTIELIPDEVQR